MVNTQQFYANAVQGSGSIASKERKYTLNFPEDVNVFKLTTEKTNVFDIIPFNVTNEKHPLVAGGRIKADGSVQDDIFVYYEHRNINDNGDSCICNNKTFGKKCPICEERQRRIDALGGWYNLTEAQQKEMKALAPKARVMMNVVDWGDRAAGIKVLTGSEFVLRQGILDGSSVNKNDEFDKNYKFYQAGTDTFELESYDRKTKQTNKIEYINYSSPISGYGIAIKCKLDTFEGNQYAKPISFELMERTKQYPKEIINHAKDLSAFINTMTYAEVEELFYGISKEDSSEVVETAAVASINKAQASMPADIDLAAWAAAENKSTATTKVVEAAPVVPPVQEVGGGAPQKTETGVNRELSDLQKLMGL